MKKLLTVCLFAFGAAAFAGTGAGDNIEPAATEKNATVTTVTKKAAAVKTSATQDVKNKSATPARAVCTTCSNDARFNLSGYFAEFVNRNNQKLVKLLLE